MGNKTTGKDDQMRKVELNLVITGAIRDSKLPWPEYGHVIAAVLTNILGNPATVCVREDGVALEFDGEGRYYGRSEKDGPRWQGRT